MHEDVPREVTRSEACMGLPPDISGISGTVTGPSHSPARLLMVVKDFCASVCTGATEDFWASVFCSSCCAKATVESDIRTTDSIKLRDFILVLLIVLYFPGDGCRSYRRACNLVL
jgi:hypothetical protein